MRVLSLIIFLIISAGLALAPTGVPLGVFSKADASTIPPNLLLASRFERLSLYAVSLAVRGNVEPRGPAMPQPETLLTYIRGRVFSGEEQMIAFALERALVSSGSRGWEAAASQCLDKRAEELTLADAAILLIHMRSPSKIWDEEVGELTERRNAFLRGMAENGYITKDDVAVAAQSPVLFCRAT